LGTQVGSTWQLTGIFPSRESALGAARTDRDFLFTAVLGEAIRVDFVPFVDPMTVRGLEAFV